MILGIGSDIIDIRRIEKLLSTQGKRFEERSFTAAERRKAGSRSRAGLKTVAAAYAKRFAAKEATAKALGCGIGRHAGLKDIEVTNLTSGAPRLKLTGNALKRLQSLTPTKKKAQLLLTLADEYPYALAFVIISAE